MSQIAHDIRIPRYIFRHLFYLHNHGIFHKTLEFIFHNQYLKTWRKWENQLFLITIYHQ